MTAQPLIKRPAGTEVGGHKGVLKADETSATWLDIERHLKAIYARLGELGDGTGDPYQVLTTDSTGDLVEWGQVQTGGISDLAVSTAKVAADAITYAKMQNVSATDRLLGRDTAGAGDVEELTLGTGLEFTGSGGIRSRLTVITGTATWNPASVAAGAEVSTTLTMSANLAARDVIAWNFTGSSMAGLIARWDHTGGTGLTFYLYNPTAGAINPGSGTLTAYALRFA